MLALWALNIKSSELFYMRIYELFQNINSALFEVSVNNHSYSLACVDATERWHASITCDVWMHEIYFSLPRHDPQRRLLKKNVNYPRETTGPCQALAEGRGNSEEGGESSGKAERSASEEGGMETGRMPGKGVWLCFWSRTPPLLLPLSS